MKLFVQLAILAAFASTPVVSFADNHAHDESEAAVFEEADMAETEEAAPAAAPAEEEAPVKKKAAKKAKKTNKKKKKTSQAPATTEGEAAM